MDGTLIVALVSSIVPVSGVIGASIVGFRRLIAGIEREADEKAIAREQAASYRRESEQTITQLRAESEAARQRESIANERTERVLNVEMPRLQRVIDEQRQVILNLSAEKAGHT